MRKIIDKKDSEKEKRNKQIWIGGLLMLIMVVSSLGFAFQGGEKKSNSDKINYNGFEFVKQGSFWVVSIGEKNFAFKYNPNEVEKINSTIKLLNSYSGKPLYIYSENEEATLELYDNIAGIPQRMQKACLEEEKCNDENLPIKTCDDNFIIIKESQINTIRQENNCVYILSKKEDFVKVADEFIFKVLNIEQ